MEKNDIISYLSGVNLFLNSFFWHFSCLFRVMRRCLSKTLGVTVLLQDEEGWANGHDVTLESTKLRLRTRETGFHIRKGRRKKREVRTEGVIVEWTKEWTNGAYRGEKARWDELHQCSAYLISQLWRVLLELAQLHPF